MILDIHVFRGDSGDMEAFIYYGQHHSLCTQGLGLGLTPPHSHYSITNKYFTLALDNHVCLYSEALNCTLSVTADLLIITL